MVNQTQHYRYNTALISLSAFFIVITIIELFWSHKTEIDLPPSNDSSIAAVVIPTYESAKIEALKHYQAIVASPLFTADRSPYETPQKPKTREENTVSETVIKETEVTNTQETSFTIQGIIRSPRSQIALLRSDQSSAVQKVIVNDEIEGWEVVSIENNEVTLRKNFEEQHLLLQPKGESSQ